jgi:ABC-2 type transport system permease protein
MRALNHALRVLVVEAKKQRRNLFGSQLVVFSLLIWPFLQLAATYYTLRPVTSADGVAKDWPLLADPRSLLLFLATGTLGYLFFWSLVQSAWQFSFERAHGTLELIFATPVNRLLLLAANSVTGVLQNTWLFVCFSVGLAALTGGIHVAHPGMYVVAFLVLLIPSVAWGALLNSVMIFARNSSFLYSILEEPMSLAAGVRLPIAALPAWLHGAGLIFPLTWSLGILRDILHNGDGIAALAADLSILSVISLALLLAAAALLRIGERRARHTGKLQLF